MHVGISFENWDGDRTVTISTESESLTLDVKSAADQLGVAAGKIRDERVALGMRR